MQQYLNHFVNHATAMFKHYEPPVGYSQWKTFLRETCNLESFRNGLKSRMQLGALTGALSIAPQLAVMRTFNSGWSANFGGVEYSYYRKIPTFLAAAAVTAPLGVMMDMVSRAYYSDKTFPKELQKGYKSILDAFKRIPFEEGPYYLFKNTFPLFIKHSIGPFTAFYCYDFMIDKLSILWRVGNMPVLPIVLACATFGTYLAAAFTYPFAHTAREMVDIWPKKDGIDYFGGNYRKAAVYIWFNQNILNFYPGFFKNYFWKIAPQYISFNSDGSSQSSWQKRWVCSNTGVLTSLQEQLITLPKTVSYDLFPITTKIQKKSLNFYYPS